MWHLLTSLGPDELATGSVVDLWLPHALSLILDYSSSEVQGELPPCQYEGIDMVGGRSVGMSSRPSYFNL